MSKFTSCDKCMNRHSPSLCSNCPHSKGLVDSFEPEPKQKIINLSMVIGSIDCEFRGDDGITIGRIESIRDDDGWFKLAGKYENYYSNCRIRQDHPHANIWDECPLPEGLEISVWYHKGGVSGKVRNYNFVNWSEVSYFKVYGTADTHCYEHELEKEVKTKTKTCSHCNGEGSIEEHGGQHTFYIECPTCKGSRVEKEE